MKYSRVLISLAAAFAACAAAPASAGDERGRRIVTVGFGAGLNTAQPGNSANHHVIPKVVKIREGDVVNFAVAGLHIIRAYDTGVRLPDVRAQIPDVCEVNPVPALPECQNAPVPVVPVGGLPVYYEGIDPFTIPQPGPPFAQASAATNRVEPVAFLKPGKFLVICAILPHFNDKMYAWVVVSPMGAPDASAASEHQSH